MQRRHLAGAAVGLLTGQGLLAQPADPQPLPQVQLAGVMGGKALLVIDGQTQMLAVGSAARGIKLLAVQGDTAEVERGGTRLNLRVGGSPAVVGTAAPKAGGAREIVLTAGPGGHFVTGGAINGQAVMFMVDTGATLVAMSQAEATRLRLDLRNAQRGMSSTANGTVPVVMVTLSSVRVGEVEVANVQAVVMPAQMEHILLGNSFLTRFQMRRENDVMRLEFRR
jgi:aspartyl protease family protein